PTPKPFLTRPQRNLHHPRRHNQHPPKTARTPPPLAPPPLRPPPRQPRQDRLPVRRAVTGGEHGRPRRRALPVRLRRPGREAVPHFHDARALSITSCNVCCPGNRSATGPAPSSRCTAHHTTATASTIS